MKIQLENIMTLASNIIESFKNQELLSTSTAKKLTINEVRTP